MQKIVDFEHFARPKPKVFGPLTSASTWFVLVMSLFALRCGPPHSNPPPENILIWLTDVPYTIVSSAPIVIPFAWQGTGQNIHIGAYLRLFDQNDQMLKGLAGPVVFNLQYDGESTFTWDGRVHAIDLGSGRRIATPPGAYRLGIDTFGDLATVHLDVQIVSNSWDGDSDDITDAVEDENAGTGGPGYNDYLRK